jgi:serine/threonine protein kinase
MKKSFKKSVRKRISKKKRISKGGFLLSKNYVFNEDNIIYTITYYRFKFQHYKIQIDGQTFEQSDFGSIPPLNKAHIIKFIVYNSEKRKLLDLVHILFSNFDLNDIIPREIVEPNLLNKFQITDLVPINQGSFGTIFITQDNRFFIKKIIKPKSTMVLNILSEVSNYYKLMTFNCHKTNKYFCDIIASYYNESQDELLIVMDICGFDLGRIISQEKESGRTPFITNQNYLYGLSIILEIAKAIQCMHSNNYVHFDIKPQNIVSGEQNQKIKLIDFGMSDFISDGLRFDSVKGTPGFVAPDFLDLKNGELKSTDVYALGIILFMFVKPNFDEDLYLSLNRILHDDKCDNYNAKETPSYLWYLIEKRFIISKTFATTGVQRQINVRGDMMTLYNSFIERINVDPKLSDITTLAQKMISFEHTNRPNIEEVILELDSIIRNRNDAPSSHGVSVDDSLDDGSTNDDATGLP